MREAGTKYGGRTEPARTVAGTKKASEHLRVMTIRFVGPPPVGGRLSLFKEQGSPDEPMCQKTPFIGKPC